MLGLGSYTFRWSIGHRDLIPGSPMTHFDLIATAASHGLGVVQFADNIPIDPLAASDLYELRKLADANKVAIELGTQPFDAVTMTRNLGYAEILGAKLLRVALDGPDAEVPVPELARSFRQLLPHAKQSGTRIAIENHFNYPSERLANLVEEIGDDGVGICLDVANSICAGEWPMQTVRLLAPWAINLHLKDYDIIPDTYGVGFAIYGTPLGQGRSDCRAILDALPEDREINVILEHWLPKGDNIKDARELEHKWLGESVAYARDILGL